jgi:guanylate kinase
MTRKGILFVISGPSGVGKGTIKEALLAKVNDMTLSISVTTRKPRTGEINGKDYFFVTSEEFTRKIDRNEFLEWAQVYSNLYGTPRNFVINELQKGHDVLLEIDIQGALQVKEKMPQGVYIFINPPSIKELANRLSSRGKDTLESISKRLAACEDEMKQVKYYNYLVVNDSVDEAVRNIKSIIIAERCKIENLNLR